VLDNGADALRAEVERSSEDTRAVIASALAEAA